MESDEMPKNHTDEPATVIPPGPTLLKNGETLPQAYKRLKPYGITMRTVEEEARLRFVKLPKKTRDWNATKLAVLNDWNEELYPLKSPSEIMASEHGLTEAQRKKLEKAQQQIYTKAE